MGGKPDSKGSVAARKRNWKAAARRFESAGTAALEGGTVLSRKRTSEMLRDADGSRRRTSMRSKMLNAFIDEGLGFPVRLANVTMVEVRGQWTPNIDYNRLTKAVVLALARKPARLTGHEVRFIRQHFDVSLQAFAARFCTSQPTVTKWERAGKRATAMAWTTEKDLRLLLLFRSGAKAADFVKLYAGLERSAPSKSVLVEVDAKKVAAR